MPALRPLFAISSASVLRDARKTKLWSSTKGKAAAVDAKGGRINSSYAVTVKQDVVADVIEQAARATAAVS